MAKSTSEEKDVKGEMKEQSKELRDKKLTFAKKIKSKKGSGEKFLKAEGADKK